MNYKKWILSPLLSAGFMLALFVCPGHTAQLKDIRIGEYNNYTRIVFELDTPAKPEKIELQSATRLAVIFSNTSAGLIRKIPVHKSPHVLAIQIWERGNRLTALLDFDLSSFGHKSFSLTDPPRLVLDIRPTAGAPPAGDAPPPAAEPDSGNDFPQTASDSGSQPAHRPDADAIQEKSPTRNRDPLSDDTHNPPISNNQTDQTAPEDNPEKAPTATMTDKAPQTGSLSQPSTMVPQGDNVLPSSTTPPKPSPRPSGARPGRLQYYLVIVLVVITIVILVLLFLMLLIRHRWIMDRSHLKRKASPENPQKT